MSIFAKPKMIEMPREVPVPLPAEVEKFAPKQYQDPSHEAVTRGVEAFVSLRDAYSILEAHHQETVVQLRTKEGECDFFRVELAQAKNDLACAQQATAEAYRERDNAIQILNSIARDLVGVDLNPVAPAKKKRNGSHAKDQEIQERLEDQVPVPPAGEPEVRELRDVPASG